MLKLEKILNAPAQYLMLAIACFIVALSVIIPVILKLIKKKNGLFRIRFLVGGLLLASFMIIIAGFIAIFTVSIKFVLAALGKIVLSVVASLAIFYFLERFVNWLSKD